MSWYETVTGTSNAERQAWRDSFNGGYAVGAGAAYYDALNGLSGGGGGGSLGGSKSGSDSQAKGSGPVNNQPVNVVKVVQPTQGGGRLGPVIQKDNGNWSPTQWAPNQAGGPVGTGNPGPGQQAGTGPGTRGPGTGFTRAEDTGDTRTLTTGFGINWEIPDYQSPGQDWEDELGDVWSVLPIGLNFADQVWRNSINWATSGAGGAATPITHDGALNDLVEVWNNNNEVRGSARLQSTGEVVFTGGGF